MKTLLRRILLVCFSLMLLQDVSAQTTAPDNNPGTGRYLGYNGAQNLEFRTNNLIRMQQMQTGNSTINGYTIARGGFLGLSQDATFFTGGLGTPYSLLHLNGNNPSGTPQVAGYRDWMRYGITFTHNDDLMFIGQRRRGDDNLTDAAIVWSDGNTDEFPDGPDNLIFVFSKGDGTGSGASSFSGLEVARMTPEAHTGIGTGWTNALQPMRTLDVARNDGAPQFRITRTRNAAVGLGTNADFQVGSAGNLYIKPKSGSTIRATAIGYLDGELTNAIVSGTILDVGGLTRVRNMPDDPAPTSVILGKRAVPGAGGSNADQFIGRVDLPNDADKFLDGTGAFNIPKDKDWDFDANNVWTGVGTGGFPDGKVGIGILGFGAAAKLHVRGQIATGSAFTTVGTWSEAIASTNIGIGAELSSSGGSSTNYGSRNQASGSSSSNFGAYGKACDASLNFGIYGDACSSSSGNYAGYFNGDVTVTGVFNNPSDAMFKTAIVPIIDAKSKILALAPSRYEFVPNQFSINLPSGPQFGLIAQEVQGILPELVVQNTHPAVIDSLGNVIHDALEYLGIRYNGLIPILIAGFQEQDILITSQAGIIQQQEQVVDQLQQTIIELQSQIESLNQQMASMLTVVQAMQTKTQNCCSDGSTGATVPGKAVEKGLELGQNVPNPFDTHTRIDFTLPTDAYVVLELSDAQGRPLRRLIEGNMTSGTHSTLLEGSALAPGMYFYTVYANGELLTKKMVKK